MSAVPLPPLARPRLPRTEAPMPEDFTPALLRLTEEPPSPLGRAVLWTLLLLLASLVAWATFGRLDIVAVADGRLVPHGYVKIVQPAEPGIVKEILVREGETVRAGQVLMRMDALLTEADARSLDAELQRRRATITRIDAELADRPFDPGPELPTALTREVAARYQANRAALGATLAEERSRLGKARADLASSEQARARLEVSLPHYVAQDQAFDKLARDGFVGQLLASDKKRERVEREQDLQTQQHLIAAAHATVQQSERRLVQIDSEYRRGLHAERNDAQAQVDRLTQDIAKLTHRQTLLELRARQDGVVKDLATHTIGAVVQPGTVLVTLVPVDEVLRAEVWIANDDIGFVHPGQTVRLKLAPFPFQKYGMIDGTVEHVSADAADASAAPRPGEPSTGPGAGAGHNAGLAYRALVALQSMQIDTGDARYALSAGMHTSAEILLGRRTVIEYLLSPLQKAWHEAARER